MGPGAWLVCRLAQEELNKYQSFEFCVVTSRGVTATLPTCVDAEKRLAVADIPGSLTGHSCFIWTKRSDTCRHTAVCTVRKGPDEMG